MEAINVPNTLCQDPCLCAVCLLQDSYVNACCMSVHKHTRICYFSDAVVKYHEGRGDIFILDYSSRGIMVRRGRKDIVIGRKGLEARPQNWLIAFHPTHRK